MKQMHASLFLLFVLCILSAAAVFPVTGDDKVTDTPTTATTPEPGPVTPSPEPPTAPPTTVPPTTIPPTTEPPTAPPTTIPPTTEPPTVPPTTVPQTTEPTETITIGPVQPGGGKGWIDTYCNVDGAAVYFDGALQGQTAGGILSVAVSPTGTPVSTISVQKSGYTAWSGPLSHMPADKEHVAVYATINPLPTQTTPPPVQNGALYAQSSPGGAAIYLNGQFQGYSPLTIPNLPPAAYSMKATLAGYTPDTRLVAVSAGQTAPYYPVLQPSPPPPRSTGTVYVTSNPNAALVYADGNYQGKAPLTVTLYPGSHGLRLSLQGYTDYTTSVYVSAGSSQTINAVMSPALYGTVTVTSMPGAAVFIDSAPRGSVPPSGTITLPDIAGGNHVFKVSAAGYNDWINTVYVVPNAVTPITATLTTPSPGPAPVPATGGLEIVSSPAGAEVFVDNLFKGYTPASLSGIAAGQHMVVLKYTGYLDYSTTAVVSAGQSTPLAVPMTPAPAPTPRSALSLIAVIGGLAAIAGTGVLLRRRY